MIGRVWPGTSLSDTSSGGSHTLALSTGTDVTEAEADPSVTSNPPLSNSQRFFVGLGISGIASYIIYSIYQGDFRGPPQIIWGALPKVKENEDRLISHVGLEKNITRPTLAMVNFPKEMRGQFERSFQSLINSAELNLIYASVVFYHDAMEVTPSNLAALVREEVLAAFDHLGGTPCAVYRSAIAVDEECVNPYWSVNEAVKASQARTFFERHCIGYTVDGGRVEILFHNIDGIVNAGTVTGGGDSVSLIPPTAKVDLHICEVEDALRRSFGATTNTFARAREGYFGTKESVQLSGSAKCLQGPYAESIGVLWLGPVPLFSMFAVALRYSRVEFDGWRLLAEPSSGSSLTPRLILQKIKRWWYSSKSSNVAEVEINREELQKPQWLSETFLLEIEICQDVSSFQSNHFNTLREALGHKNENDKKDEKKMCNNNRDGSSKDAEHLVITSTLPISGGRGAILCSRLSPGLTVFQAFREAWRLTALVACLNYDVRCFRLLTPVKCSSSSCSSQSLPHIPLYPVSPDDVKMVCPSSFSSSQYFYLPDDGSRVGMTEAFRCIREGNVQKLHYVLAEYVLSELSQDE